jgi:DNA-binding IclR family transcriptional regulator
MYGPGPRVLTLAGQISATLDYAAVASPELRRLQDMTPHTIHFGVLVDVEAVYVAKLEGTRPYQMRSTIGMRLPLHCTAIGKAILAYLPDLELAELLSASKLTRNTQRTITSPQLLRDELRSVKQSGYAIDDEENEEGIRCVAAPVFGADGHVVGAISVAAPTFDLALSDIASVAPHIIRAADGVSHRLGAVRDQGAGPEVIPARMSGRFPNQKEGSGDKKPTHP